MLLSFLPKVDKGCDKEGDKRQYNLCTNNGGICEKLTYERNKRVINGYTMPNGERVDGLHNNNLRYYRTDFVSRSSHAADYASADGVIPSFSSSSELPDWNQMWGLMTFPSREPQ